MSASILPKLDLAELFDGDVLIDATGVDGGGEDLFAEERATVNRAVPRRKSEFAAGRRCARQLLARLGYENAPLPAAADRVPQWPDGVVGSIAHNRELCVVAVARKDSFAGLGIDVEAHEPLEPELWSNLCTGPELIWLKRQPAVEQGRWMRVFFVAKEATYKCWFSVTRTPLEFHDVMVRIDSRTGRFQANICRAKTAGFEAAALIAGRYLVRGRWVFAGTVLRPS